MMALGARLARAVNRVFQRKGPVLTNRYHLTVLKSPTQVRNAIAYVLLNARRHAAKAGKEAIEDGAIRSRVFGALVRWLAAAASC